MTEDDNKPDADQPPRPRQENGPGAPKPDRDARLKAALRANLRRRKAAGRNEPES